MERLAFNAIIFCNFHSEPGKNKNNFSIMNLVLCVVFFLTAEKEYHGLHEAKCLDWNGALLVWSRSGLLAPAGELMNAQDVIYYLDSDI